MHNKTSSQRYPSVYGPLDRRWATWEKKMIEGGRMESKYHLQVHIQLSAGHTVEQPLDKAKRKAIRGVLGLNQAQTH